MAINLNGKKTSLKEDASIYEKRNDNMSEKERIQNMSAKERRTHFVTYYLPKLLIIVAVAAAIFYIIWVDFIQKSDIYMHCAILNESISEDSLVELSDQFTESMEMDSDKNRVSFAIHYTNTELAMEFGQNAGNDLSEISSRLIANMLDVMIASPEDVEQSYLKNGFIADLSTFLTDEEYASLADYLYVPETAEPGNGHAYGIHLAKSSIYQTLFDGQEPLQEDPVFFLITNAKDEGKEYARHLIHYLFPETDGD